MTFKNKIQELLILFPGKDAAETYVSNKEVIRYAYEDYHEFMDKLMTKYLSEENSTNE